MNERPYAGLAAILGERQLLPGVERDKRAVVVAPRRYRWPERCWPAPDLVAPAQAFSSVSIARHRSAQALALSPGVRSR